MAATIAVARIADLWPLCERAEEEVQGMEVWRERK